MVKRTKIGSTLERIRKMRGLSTEKKEVKPVKKTMPARIRFQEYIPKARLKIPPIASPRLKKKDVRKIKSILTGKDFER